MNQVEKIIEGMKVAGRPVDIPDVGRNDLPALWKSLGFKVIVEVGVYRGEYGEVLAKSGLQVFGVDPWLASVDYPYYSGKNTQQIENDNYAETVRRLSPYPNYQLIRNTSMGALDYFEDESIDAVYIDGNHSFQYVAEDICGWIKKVKKNGHISGHDYLYGNKKNFHVKYVVDSYVEAHGIKNLWILGNKNAAPGEVRDKWRSWVFRKP